VKISVLFFGATADAAGTRRGEIAISEGASVGLSLDHLIQLYPRLANHKLLIAVNEEYAESETTLKPGDELAIFTPVSGG
jgi:molybdopterin converting factor subunit 1